jgi:hypothetical protein
VNFLIDKNISPMLAQNLAATSIGAVHVAHIGHAWLTSMRRNPERLGVLPPDVVVVVTPDLAAAAAISLVRVGLYAPKGRELRLRQRRQAEDHH